jgi:hypothetical protein
MGTFEDYKRELNENHAYPLWVKKNETPPEEIYWKLIQSGTALNNKLANYPDDETIKTNLQRLARIVSALSISSGLNIFINSGYRNTAVNTKVGGAKASQHMKGEATDMDVESDVAPLSTDKNEKQNAKLFLFIINNEQWKNKFDQIIYEESGTSNWVHCSFKCNSDDIGNDASYSPRPYGDARKVLWYKNGTYINLWTSNYKRETPEGYVYFENVSRLQGIKYDGKSFEIDYSKISDVSGSQLSEYSSENSGGESYGGYLEQKYGGNGQPNKVTRLSKARNRLSGSDPNVNTTRKDDFSKLADTLIDATPSLGRNIRKSEEMYDSCILKGEQVSKKVIRGNGGSPTAPSEDGTSQDTNTQNAE